MHCYYLHYEYKLTSFNLLEKVEIRLKKIMVLFLTLEIKCKFFWKLTSLGINNYQ